MVITVNDKEVKWEKGLTVSKLLKKMKFTNPMIVVKINDKSIDPKDYDKTTIPDKAEVQAIHLISGG